MDIAHTGASVYPPVCTFNAFDQALSLGVGLVELGVHFSSDGPSLIPALDSWLHNN